MRIGVFATRLAGTDGVSLETAKWADVLERMGHEVHYCAGELDEHDRSGELVPAMHFRDERAAAVARRAFAGTEPDPALERTIQRLADALEPPLQRFVSSRGIELLVVENAHAIPMQLPLGLALGELVASTGLPTIAHHHDFYWERERFARHRIGPLLDRCFPFDGPNVRHVVIHTKAAEDLAARRGLSSVVVPNVLDFAQEPPDPDGYAADFRSAVGLGPHHLLVLQPTRVVRRKGIELAIELLARLGRSDAALLITHEAGDEGLDYLAELERLARNLAVDLRYRPDRIGPRRRRASDGGKIYALADAYRHADFVTYPSRYEGFGNALLEAIYFRRPVLVHPYPVYVRDIAPTGFDLVEVDGAITDEAVARVQALLGDEELRRAVVEHNVAVARAHFSYEVLERKLAGLLDSF